MSKRKSASDCMFCECAPCECSVVSSKKKSKPAKEVVSVEKRVVEKKVPSVEKTDMKSAMKRAATGSLRPSMMARRTMPTQESASPIQPLTLASAIQKAPPALSPIKKRMSREDVMQTVAIGIVSKVLGGVLIGENKAVYSGPMGLGERITYLQTRLN